MEVNIQSVRRVLDLDFDQIEKWCEKRGFTHMADKSLFPPTGFIVDDVAVGFIYFTDSLVAIIDCYISNPDVDSKTRSNALNAITLALIGRARFHGCKLIKCDSKLDAIKQRALSFGFKELGRHESFALEL